MSISVAAKIGGGLLVAAGTPTTLYYSWDHITMYSVEREVISKDLKLTVTGPTGETEKKITIEAPKTVEGTNLKLDEGKTWKCEITSESTVTMETSLATKIQNNLQKTSENINEEQRKNKELLVRACSKNRKEGHSNSEVVGTLRLGEKTEGSTKIFFFVNHSELDPLLKEEAASSSV